MKFLLDNNLSPKLARALAALSEGGHEVVALRDRFPADTSDETWIRQLGKEGGWCVVSGDRFLKTPGERAAWRESKLTTFFLAPGWSSLTHWAKAAKLVHAWPIIESTAVNVEAGAAFEVKVSGKLSVLQKL
jgi:hypothetical protein